MSSILEIVDNKIKALEVRLEAFEKHRVEEKKIELKYEYLHSSGFYMFSKDILTGPRAQLQEIIDECKLQNITKTIDEYENSDGSFDTSIDRFRRTLRYQILTKLRYKLKHYAVSTDRAISSEIWEREVVV